MSEWQLYVTLAAFCINCTHCYAAPKMVKNGAFVTSVAHPQHQKAQYHHYINEYILSTRL